MGNEPERADRDNTTPTGNRSGGHVDQQETKPAEEWGERLDTGKTIARGGKEHGHVPGAEPGK